jgi:four helix bundle protein
MDIESEKPTTFFRFEDLRVYHKALDYITWVYSKMDHFPDAGGFSIGRRFLDAAQSIALHIAEGSARNKSQFIYFLKMAKSSVRECVVHTTMAGIERYLNSTEMDESRGLLEELTRMLGALIGSLQRSAGMNEYDSD